MKREELQKLIVGPIATVNTAFDDQFMLDLGRMAAATEFWVGSGLVKGTAVIKVAANIGEGPQLADEEWPYLLRTVVQAAKGKAAVVGSIHYKDTVRSIADAKRAQDLGAIGLQVTPPMFNYPTQDDLLRYYGALSDAIEIGIIVYNTWDRYVPGIQADTIAKMKDFEHVVAVKWGVPPDQENTYDEMSKFVGFLNVIDMDGKVAHCMRMGGRGYINLTADVYPPHDLKIWQLLENKKYDEAQALFDRVDMPLKEFFGKAAARSGGAARMKKGMTALMGMPMGSSRPPTLPLDAGELDELRRILVGFGWPVPTA